MDSGQASFRLLVWFFFFDGVAIHIMLRARASIAARSNAVRTFRTWWEHNWKDLGWRLFLDGVGLMVWEIAPPSIKQLFPPVSYAIAPWMGFAVDRFVDSSGFILGFSGVDMGEVAPSKQM